MTACAASFPPAVCWANDFLGFFGYQGGDGSASTPCLVAEVQPSGGSFPVGITAAVHFSCLCTSSVPDPNGMEGRAVICPGAVSAPQTLPDVGPSGARPRGEPLFLPAPVPYAWPPPVTSANPPQPSQVSPANAHLYTVYVKQYTAALNFSVIAVSQHPLHNVEPRSCHLEPIRLPLSHC